MAFFSDGKGVIKIRRKEEAMAISFFSPAASASYLPYRQPGNSFGYTGRKASSPAGIGMAAKRGVSSFTASTGSAAFYGAKEERTGGTVTEKMKQLLKDMRKTQGSNPYGAVLSDVQYSAAENQPVQEDSNNADGEVKQTGTKSRQKFVGTSESKKNGYLEVSKTAEDKSGETAKKPLNYNSTEISSRIQRAKNSMSAGEAMLSAKRKVRELKRKISIGKEDPEELQLALTHAKRMEMAARKKKHHLELEELITITQKRDETLEKKEETASDLKGVLINEGEEKIAEREDEIFAEREDMIRKAMELNGELVGTAFADGGAALQEDGGTEASFSGEMSGIYGQTAMEDLFAAAAEGTADSGVSDDLMTELNEMISEFGEEELKQLEEAMEMLESMEVVDPHMSEQELQKLKRKHRAAESKAIVKANMDYLKGLLKHQSEKAEELSKMAVGVSSAAAVAKAPAAKTVSVDPDQSVTGVSRADFGGMQRTAHGFSSAGVPAAVMPVAVGGMVDIQV